MTNMMGICLGSCVRSVVVGYNAWKGAALSVRPLLGETMAVMPAGCLAPPCPVLLGPASSAAGLHLRLAAGRGSGQPTTLGCAASTGAVSPLPPLAPPPDASLLALLPLSALSARAQTGGTAAAVAPLPLPDRRRITR